MGAGAYVHVDITQTLASIDVISVAVDVATEHAVADAAALVQRAAQALAPIGVEGNATDPPGTLAASIRVDGPSAMEDHAYQAKVGPTTVYGRQRELGGSIFPQASSALAFTKFGTRLVIGPGVSPAAFGNTVYLNRPGVTQEPRPYLKPAVEETEPLVLDLFAREVEDALHKGGAPTG